MFKIFSAIMKQYCSDDCISVGFDSGTPWTDFPFHLTNSSQLTSTIEKPEQ